MAEMNRIYEDTKLVFVLDAELEVMDRPSSLVETAFRVLTSDWMHRLWTLQEAYLAKKLWVQFRDGAFQLDQEGIGEMNLNDLPVSQYGFGKQVKALYASLRTRVLGRVTITRQNRSSFTAINLQNRSVTEPSDEPLCVARLLNLHVKTITDVTTADQNCTRKRTSIFWNLLQRKLRDLPKSLLFHHQPRLLVDGYRWAPATFLGQTAIPLLTTLFSGPLVPRGQFDRKGFRIKSEGLLFPTTPRRSEFLQIYHKVPIVDVTQNQTAYLRTGTGEWFIFQRTLNKQDQSTTSTNPIQLSDVEIAVKEAHEKAKDRKTVRYGVIFRDNIIDRSIQGQSQDPSQSQAQTQPSGIGLLVALHTPEDPATHRVTAIETIIVNQALPMQAKLWEIMYQIAEDARKSEAFQQSDDAAAMEAQVVQSAHERVANDASVAAFGSIGWNANMLATGAFKMIVGAFGIDVELQSSRQSWCVD